MHLLTALPLLLAPQTPSLPPTAELTGFTHTEAASLEDYFGQAVLVDFFAQWCAPCARQVPHLNDLAERFGDRGLHVLGVTSDARDVAEAWLERFGAEYPHAFDETLAVQIELGFRPLPFAILIDPMGLIVWSGNPGELEDATIEAALETSISLPAHAWPAEAHAAREALPAGKLASAAGSLEGLDDVRFARDLHQLLRAAIMARLRLVETAWERGDYLTVARIAPVLAEDTVLEITQRHLTRHFLRYARTLEEEGRRRILAGQRELALLWSSVGQVRTSAQADELRGKIEAFEDPYLATYVAVQAADYASALKLLAASLP